MVTTASALLFAMLLAAANAIAAAPEKPAEPDWLPGKDTPWVPSPAATVGKMLEVARVTAEDYVIDLGSGDGRNVIAAARLGARGLGVEFNPELVALSERAAADAGVSDKATFVQGDMFTADISQASVMMLFLMPENLARLEPRLLALRPGTRIVVNTFGLDAWVPAEIETAPGDCSIFCKVILYIVPARVAGRWRLAQGELELEQSVQQISGTLTKDGIARKIESGRVTGDQVAFTVDGVRYKGRVSGNAISGSAEGSGSTPWSAVRQ